MNRAIRLGTILALLVVWEFLAQRCGDPTRLAAWWPLLGGDPRLAGAIGVGLYELLVIGGLVLVALAAVAVGRRLRGHSRADRPRRLTVPGAMAGAFGGLRCASTVTLLGAYTEISALALLAVAIDELSERLLGERTAALLRYSSHEKWRSKNSYRWSRWRDHR